MALLERVTTLLRANLGDLITKAEDPETLARQLVLDMENQLLQVKTQVAIAIADQHLLEGKREEQWKIHAECVAKAQAAVAKDNDQLARAALERGLSHKRMAESLGEQCADQEAEAAALRATYLQLQQKLAETKSRVEILRAQLRRSRAVEKAAEAQSKLRVGGRAPELQPLKRKVDETASRGKAARSMMEMVSPESVEERFSGSEQKDQVEAMLMELKERKGLEE